LALSFSLLAARALLLVALQSLDYCRVKLAAEKAEYVAH
jgi:hypothetical protein